MDIEDKEFLLFLKCAHKNKLRYLCIGGYAVNYHGFHRSTEDLDIWIAPTNENKALFLDSMKCMGYTDSEIGIVKEEDFTSHFVCSLGTAPSLIDVLTVVHRQISFDDAENKCIIHPLSDDLELKIVSYDLLKDIKLRSSRPKDLFDIARLEELRNKKRS